MSDPAKAVFLSYAHDDAAVARRLAEALRATGIPVWFDESELRGGEAWDQKIRRQIKECALFVPIISAHTEERGEGYSRLEWKLADERSALIAKGLPFLLPVTLDDTSESDALVPDSFRAVQWMQVRGENGNAADLAVQVQRLLLLPRRTSDAGRGHPTRSQPPANAQPAGLGELALPQPARAPVWPWAAAIAVAGLVAIAIVPRLTKTGDAGKAPAEGARAILMNRKSPLHIAVVAENLLAEPSCNTPDANSSNEAERP